MSSSLDGHIGLRFQAESIPPSVLLPFLAGFRQLYPMIRVTLAAAPAAEIEAELIADKLSFAVVHGVGSGDFLTTAPAGELVVEAVAAPGYLAGREPPIADAQSVLTADLIATSPDAPMARRWLGAPPDAPLTPRLLVPSIEVAVEAATRGCGVTFAPRILVEERVARGELALLPAPQSRTPIPLALAYRKKNSRPLAESVFLEYALEHEIAPSFTGA